MSIVFRPMTEADIPAVRDLWQNTEHMGLGPEDQPERLKRQLARSPGLSHVAIDTDGRVIAAAMGHDDGRRGMLTHVAVAAERRGEGIGRDLVARVLDAMRHQGLRRCDLLVFADNDRGRAFWRRLGWQERPDVLWMKREL